jgi:VWFA-related protein
MIYNERFGRLPVVRKPGFCASLLPVFVLIAAVLTTNGSTARAQTPKTPTFGAGITEVMVPVTVTDDKGRFVSDLTKDDFHVFDEGKEQKIDYFSHEQSQPIVIGFLIDMSNGMRVNWERFQESTTELMLNLLPGDKKYAGYLITYGNTAELVTDTSSDSDAMVQKLKKMKPAGGSALFDAIYMACTSRKTVQGEPYEPRRVLVIIGDGHDSASKKTLREAQEIAQRSMVTIYAMSTVTFGMHTEGEDNLDLLASATGGKVERPLGENTYKDIAGFLSKPSDAGNYAIEVGTGGYTAEISKSIFKSVANLIGEITTQYIIRYHPDFGTDQKQFRHIKVNVALPVNLRYREGYYPYAVPQ